MAKSNHISGLLLLAVVCIHFSFGRNSLTNGYQAPGTGDQAALMPVRIEMPAGYLQKRNLIRQIYDSQLGVRESGINRGLQIEQYLKYVDLARGNPWCAAFVCWVLGKAGVENPKTGWSPGLFPSGKVIWDRGGKLKVESGKLIPQVQERGGIWSMKGPQTADVFGIYFTEKKRIAHVGFIDQWDGTWLITVEGNTNENGSREGDGVYRKRRTVSSIYQVARYINQNSKY